MTRHDTFRDAGLFDTTAPRYTSYPPANHFGALDAAVYEDWLRALPPEPVSLYVHIPFCERLCWFCACRTQAVNGQAPLEAYLDMLEAEIIQVARHLPAGISIGRLHWGGGTPTILSPAQIARLAAMLRAAFRYEPDAEISVEIDPSCCSPARLDALVEAGLTRASLGVQDFSREVQDTIGRHQSVDSTRAVLRHLRAAGVSSLNADLVYGLPNQTLERLEATLHEVIDLAPDRLALYGYAHVPWMARRQAVIPAETLPCPETRLRMADRAQDVLVEAGYQPIGIDHFAKPGDALAVAARTGRLRRNFQGYTDDTCATLIGLGASSISRLPQGYAQNAAQTRDYARSIQAGCLPVAKGVALTAEDHLRAHMIETLMCHFEVSLCDLERAGFGARDQKQAGALMGQAAAQFPNAVVWTGTTLRLKAHARPLCRLIAARFDGYSGASAPRAARHASAI